MRLVKAENSAKMGVSQLEFGGMDAESLQMVRDRDRIGIFNRGFCCAIFSEGDRFARNFFLVQLHIFGRVKLKELASLFGLGYQQCSNLVTRYKTCGIEGIRDESEKRIGTRRIITSSIGEFILERRKEGKTYREIVQGIRFRFKKKIKAQTIRVWMCTEGKDEEQCKHIQLEFPGFGEEENEEEFEEPVTIGQWQWNSYAGSFILYSMIEQSGFLKIFEEAIDQDPSRRGSRWDVKRVLLTLFFLHALRLKSVEQSKHLVARDFLVLVGGEFFRGQRLRYAVDAIVKHPNFDKAINVFYRRLLDLTDLGDKLFYTDGHFSSYYGKRPIPKGYDPRRQMGFRGRNTVYLHNSNGENVYLFESPTNTSLSNDIETLITDLEKLQLDLKGRTIAFDRGGYSAKCFRRLKKSKLYFITYLKNRKKERLVEEEKFVVMEAETEEGGTVKYRLFEKEVRETRHGKVRTIVLLGDDGKQIPILSTNPYLTAAEIVYRLQRRWREENCFKYMIEHFGIDLLTTYKTEEAPDKVIERAHPGRVAINNTIAQKKIELEDLQVQLAKKIQERAVTENGTVKEFLEEENELNFAIKNAQVDLDFLQRQRETIPTTQKKNLREDHVIISEKRRLLINAMKALNYNCEKWLQRIFKEHHLKDDEILSLIRNIFRQPGRVMMGKEDVQVELSPLDIGGMRKSLEQTLEKLSKIGCLRLPDGRALRVTQVSEMTH